MTTTMYDTLTARTFLLGQDEHDATVLRRSLAEHGVMRSCGAAIGRLTGTAGEAVRDELASVSAGLLDIDLGDLLICGWRTHKRLRAAAEATAGAPGSEEIVRLASHKVSSAHHPTVDILVDGFCVHSFEFVLTVDFHVDLLVAVVRGGNLVAVKCDGGTVTAVLAVDGMELARRSRRLNPELLVDLRHGVPLV